MKIRQTVKDGDNVTFEVVADATDVARALQTASEAFASAMGLMPEPGKTVAQVAEEKMGIRDLDAMVASGAVEALVPLVLDKKNVIPLYPPVPHPKGELKRGSEFRFSLEVALRPEYELSSYDPVKIEVPAFHVDESQVDAQIDQMTASYTAYVEDEDAPLDVPVASGDFVKLSIEATEDGKEFKGLSTSGRTYAVGAGHMPQGFDDNVQGMKVGETKSFTFKAPSFDEEFNEVESTVDATVTVLAKLRESRPEIDDAWVRKNMPMFKGVEEMRANIRKSIEIQGRESYKAYLRQRVASELAKRFEGKIPDEAYEAMMAQVRENLQKDLRNQGMTWDKFVEENGGESQVSMLLMLQAREALTEGYALDAVFRHFGLVVTDDDIEQVCRAMNPGADPKQLHEEIRQRGLGFALRESAERFKANEYTLDQAEVTYV